MRISFMDKLPMGEYLQRSIKLQLQHLTEDYAVRRNTYLVFQLGPKNVEFIQVNCTW